MNKLIAKTIYSNLTQISEEIASAQAQQRAEISPKFGLNYSKYNDYSRHDLHQLAEALTANNPSQFARYISWQHSMLKGHKVPEYFVELNLQTEQSALIKILPEEFHSSIIDFMQNARESLKEKDQHEVSFLQEAGTHAALAKNYLDLLLDGERGDAGELIIRSINSGISIRDIYLKVFKPCLYEVGRLWQTGQITVAHEHFISSATQLIMSELYPLIRKNSKSKQNKVLVASCVSGELHEIGLRMSADLMELEGWRTYYLGPNTPALSVIDMAREKKAKLLMLSICLPTNGPALRELINLSREQLGNSVKIVIGGYIVSTDAAYGSSFNADAVASGAGEAAILAETVITGERHSAR